MPTISSGNFVLMSGDRWSVLYHSDKNQFRVPFLIYEVPWCQKEDGVCSAVVNKNQKSPTDSAYGSSSLYKFSSSPVEMLDVGRDVRSLSTIAVLDSIVHVFLLSVAISPNLGPCAPPPPAQTSPLCGSGPNLWPVHTRRTSVRTSLVHKC
jgi:hypothetical protein